RVIMPVDAFANAVDLMQKALHGLVAAGAVRRVTAAAAQSANRDAQTNNLSPNLNMDIIHTILQCLALVARHHGVDLSPERLMHDYAIGDEPVSVPRLLRIAQDAGFRAKHSTLSWQELQRLGQAYPVLAKLENGNWVIIAGMQGTPDGPVVRVLDPLAHKPEALLLTERQFSPAWTGIVIFMKRKFRLTDEEQPFGFRWFLPELIRQRSLFRDVAIAALIL